MGGWSCGTTHTHGAKQQTSSTWTHQQVMLATYWAHSSTFSRQTPTLEIACQKGFRTKHIFCQTSYLDTVHSSPCSESGLQHAGTGLSYSETHADYLTNDTHTAQDSNRFMRGFLDHYPEYAKNDFYIIGKGYGICMLSYAYRVELPVNHL